MKIVNYISTIAVPVVIIIIVIYGIADKKKVYDIFVEGATEGMSIVIKIFPTLLGIFLAVGVLRSSGLLKIITILSVSKRYQNAVTYTNTFLCLLISFFLAKI